MANVSKGFGVGDTVWVRYPYTTNKGFTPQSRVVSSVDVLDGTNEATVHFTNGEPVVEGATVRVYTTQALCATGIVNDVITQVTAAVLLDATLSGASTAGNASVTLIRSDT